LARMLSSLGKKVWGSDNKQSQITNRLISDGIKVIIGHSLDNLEPKPDLVIYSEDVTRDSPGFVELARLDQLGITKLTQAEAVGQLMDDKFGIGVTGTNGKSTTTAMLGLILEAAGTDPSVLVGSLLSAKNESEKFKANARLGTGQFFVAESDEYARKMLKNHPKMIVVTNIAEDHLDYYKDLNDIKEAFRQYIHSLPKDGILIYNADDHNTIEVCRNASCHKFTFGIHHYADLQAINVELREGGQRFDLHLNNVMIGEIELCIPGVFNVANALGAILSSIKLGIKLDVIQRTLAAYAAIWRRFEQVGKLAGKVIISDYAHHPAAITATIEAAKQFYPQKKILVVFQPHHHNRTKALFGEFVESLLSAPDELIIPEIFDVIGREHGEQISSQQLVEELNKKGERAIYASDLDQCGQFIHDKISKYDVVLLMGAGDIDTLARNL